MNIDNEIRRLAEQDLSSPAIAAQLGMNTEYVRQRLRAMNLTGGKLKPFYGITHHSYNLRALLGSILTELIENNLQPDVSALTGLNRNEIAVARQAPYEFDWKLSQIERTLACAKRTVENII